MRRLFSDPVGRKMGKPKSARPAFAGKAHDPELSTARWQAVRLAQLNRCPICELCESRPAGEVHHVIPRADGGETFDMGNLLSVCGECHKGIPAMYRRGVLTPDKLLKLVAERRVWRGLLEATTGGV